MNLSSLRIIISTFLFFFTSKFFLATTCASADARHKRDDVRPVRPVRPGYRRGQELHKINFLINEIFERSLFPLQCLRKSEKKANARECMMELENWAEGTSPYDCKFFQAEYDCIVVTTRGCYGRDLVITHFREIQQELAAKYGCKVEEEIDVSIQNPIEGDDYRRSLNITTTTTTTTPRPTDETFTKSPTKRRRRRSRSRLRSRGQTKMNYAQNSNPAPLRILGNMVSFIFTWIPRSIILIVSDEEHYD